MSDDPSKTVLAVQQLQHTYQFKGRDLNVFQGVDLSVRSGQVVAVCGESGSGKTTLLLACGGMQRPTDGGVSLNGQELFELSAFQRAKVRAHRIGFMFQTLELLPYLNLIDNVRLAHGVGRVTAIKWLEKLGLGDRLKHLPESLSHGQRQRTALARALAHSPQFLIADEPTGNLGEKNTRLVFETLRAYARDGGAVLVATHEAKIQSFADSILRIEDGGLVGGADNAR